MYIYLYIHIYMDACICVYIYIYIYVYICAKYNNNSPGRQATRRVRERTRNQGILIPRVEVVDFQGDTFSEKPRIKPKPKRNHRFRGKPLQNPGCDVSSGSLGELFGTPPSDPGNAYSYEDRPLFASKALSFLSSLLFSRFSSLFSRFGVDFDLLLEPKERKRHNNTDKYRENLVKTRDQTRERERTAEIAPARAGSSGKHLRDVEN